MEADSIIRAQRSGMESYYFVFSRKPATLFSHESLQSTRKTAAVSFHVQEWLGLVCHPGSQLEPPCYAALLEMPVQPSALGVGLYPKTPCYTRYMFRGHCEEEGYCRQGPTTPAVAFKIVRETFLEPS